jgi:hypothetical protein
MIGLYTIRATCPAPRIRIGDLSVTYFELFMQTVICYSSGLRGSTPVPPCARATPGFSGATPSGPRLHLANTTTGCTSLRSGCAAVRFAASAKRHALRAVSIARPPPHPRHRCACRGPSARKTLTDRGEASADLTRPSTGSHSRAWYWLPVLLRGR